MNRHPEGSASTSALEIHTPDMYICPISTSLMHDPVVVVETGQVYDNVSITRWFEAGNNTCPLTGISLTSQKLTRLPALRSNIAKWANDHGIDLEPPEKLSPIRKEVVELDNLSRSYSFVTSRGISVYDPEGIVKLMAQNETAEKYAALVVLRDLLNHADEQQFRQISNMIDIDYLKNLLTKDDISKPAARLLVSLKKSLNMEELATMIVIPDVELQIELLTRLVNQYISGQSTTSRCRRSPFALSKLMRRVRRACSFRRGNTQHQG